MNGSPELLEFYLVEATEYVDALDQLVGNGAVASEANAFIATARALRGSSTMAKATAIAELSLLIEQIAQALREGELRWTLDLSQSMRATVDDLRFLVRGVRMWGAREQARCEVRVADLRRFVPDESGKREDAPASGAAAPVFVALQASAIAAELDAFVQNPDSRRAIDDALTRARTLRGLAGIGDYPPLSDVADAIERQGRALMPDAPLSREDAELFRASAALLRRASEELRTNGAIAPDSDEVGRFARAVGATRRETSTPESVVPIESLYYTDAGPHVVERGSRPATTPEQRFRQELASRGENLVRLVDEARGAHDQAAIERVVRDLSIALRDVERFSTGGSAHQVSAFFGQIALEPDLLAPIVLEALSSGAMITANAANVSIDEIERRLAMLERARRTPASVPVIPETPARASAPVAPTVPPTPPPAAPPVVTAPRPAAPATPPAPKVTPQSTTIASLFSSVATPPRSESVPTPPAAPAQPAATPPAATRPPEARVPSTPAIGATPTLPPRPASPQAAEPSLLTPASKRPSTPTGRELQDLLGRGIAAFAPLEDVRLAEPAIVDEDEIVPIESLLYRGDAAIERAIELRDSLRAAGFATNDTLQELFDLLDLARAE